MCRHEEKGYLDFENAIRFPNALYGDNKGVRSFVQGHVEIFHDNRWGTICDRSFDEISGERNANVLCHMGGYKRGEYMNGRYRQPHATKAKQIWLTEVFCRTGTEANIGSCE